jgi:murein DD-endopeptidase MepM/ murein hydrolase activator NlpD
MGGHGNLVILKHDRHYYTAYGHLMKSMVAVGQELKKGQILGKVGNTGNASGFVLHFEVRHKREAQDPLNYLP